MYTNVFLIVVLFGAGTDYCLFLISRFREEMAGAALAAPAVKTTVRAVGETIASSAGTVIVGLAMMIFAELGLYNTTGPGHRHRGGHHPAGRPDAHTRPARRARSPRLLAAQGRGTSATRASGPAGRPRWSSTP